MALGFVRPARPEDAAEIARIQLSTWRTAYRRMFPPHVLDNLDEGYLARGWTEAITAPPSARHRVLIAVEQGESSAHVVGFAASGPADEHALAPEEKPLPDDVVAVTDLLIEPRWGRRGHGSRLLAAAVDNWRDDGFRTAVAWVYDADAAMRAFLGSTGWEPDGAGRALDVDDLLVPQLRLHVAVNADEPATVNADEPATVSAAEPVTVSAAEPVTVSAAEPVTVNADEHAAVNAAEPAGLGGDEPVTFDGDKPGNRTAAPDSGGRATGDA